MPLFFSLHVFYYGFILFNSLPSKSFLPFWVGYRSSFSVQGTLCSAMKEQLHRKKSNAESRKKVWDTTQVKYLLWLAISTTNSRHNYVACLSPITVHNSRFHFLQKPANMSSTIHNNAQNNKYASSNNALPRKESEQSVFRAQTYLVISNFHIIHLLGQPVNSYPMVTSLP